MCFKPVPLAVFKLGSGKNCQIGDCDKQAYLVCKRKLYNLFCCSCTEPVWTGCGKRMCEDHISIHYDFYGNVSGVHCKYIEGDKKESGMMTLKSSELTKCGGSY